jgi:hypothetical protein
MLTGESWFHISTPQGIWTRVPCDGKQTGSPLDQWEPTLLVVKLEGETCSERETGTGKLCDIKWDYHIVG